MYTLPIVMVARLLSRLLGREVRPDRVYRGIILGFVGVLLLLFALQRLKGA